MKRVASDSAAQRASRPLGRVRLDFFGRLVEVRSGDAVFLNRVVRQWDRIVSRRKGKPEVVFECVDDGAPSRITRPQQFSGAGFVFLADGDRYQVTGYFRGRPSKVFIQTFGEKDPDYVYFYLFEPFLISALKRMRIVSWHCSAVTRGGDAILFPADSGSGKSTTALGLLRSGFKFLADDEAFLVPGAGGIHAWSSEREIHVLDSTIEFFGEACGKLELPRVRKGGSGWKRRISAAPERRKSRHGRVRLVVFPKIGRSKNPRARTLSMPEALARCMSLKPKEYPALVRDPIALERQMGLYGDLVSGASCQEILLGTDWRANNLLIERLFGEARS